ncbi:SGNH/GDSL hydrolase family protein, partial [Saprospiraceae bacterium]|nr:SGNH/GDSL hydrolase family protein [Saprospiraceae bacterium]
ISMLNLGDSYTYGQGVCETCTYPHMLMDSLMTATKREGEYTSIAATGWTTTDLLNSIATEDPNETFDIVTLLIGVNNQYQNKDFSIYEKEFVELLEQSIVFADGNREHVFVISIPDYAFTPQGQNSGVTAKISDEIDQYNAYAKEIAEQNEIRFIDVTEISRLGLVFPELVGSDGLHPSKEAYRKFVNRLFEPVYETVKD